MAQKETTPNEVGNTGTESKTKLPTTSATTGDATLEDDKAEFLAYRVAKDAEQQIMSKAKWIAGMFAIALTVIGLRAWHDYRTAINTLDERIDKKLQVLLDTKHARIEQLEQKMSDQYIESVIEAKQEAGRQLTELGDEATKTIDHFRTLAKSASDELKLYKRDVERNRLEITAIFERQRINVSDVATPEGPRHSGLDVFGPTEGGFLGMLAAGPDSVGADAFIDGEYHGAFHYHFVRNMRKQLDLGLNEISAELAFKGAAQDIKANSFSQVPLFVGGDWRIAVDKSNTTGPKLHALLIGVNDYKDISDLRGCINDTKQLRTLLEDSTQPIGTLLVLTDTNANATAIRKSLKTVCDAAAPGDTIVFSFSGHQTYTKETKGAHSIICSHDFDFEKQDTLLTLKWVSDMMRNAKCSMRVVIAG